MSQDKSFFGHPRGLATLFFTEMWERFSYYGMRALLILFMTAAVASGGLGFDDKTAGAVYGLYTMGVYLLALPGGWLADHILGLKRAVWYGGIVIALGHFTMGLPGIALLITGETAHDTVSSLDLYSFYFGLILITIGTGLLKPNISSIVGALYEDTDEGNARRDAGFSIFYMGINLGALISPIVCGYLGEQVDWHLGFGMAGFGMVLGLIQYKLTERHIEEVGNEPVHDTPELQASRNKTIRTTSIIGGIVGVLTLLFVTGIIPIDAVTIANASGAIIITIGLIFFGMIFFKEEMSDSERNKVKVIGILLFASAVFWSGFEQAGSSLSLFADRFTDRTLFGFEIPASTFQSINAMFIIIFAPFFGAMWVWLAKRHLEPSSPLKFAFGLILLGMGFLVMYFAAKVAATGAATGELAAPAWLVFTYLLHTFGELSLSPVGLSLVTKLSPQRLVGQMMGMWFLSVSLGNLLAGLISSTLSGNADAGGLEAMPSQYLMVVATTVGAGLILVAFAPKIRKLMGHIH